MRRKFLMKPSSFRISASRTFSFEEGMSTFSCSARLPLRMRASMSATGSVTIAMGRSPSGRLPGGLHHTRDLAAQGQAPEADSAQLELAEIPARAPAQPATRVGAHLELRNTPLFVDQGRLCHELVLRPTRGT